MEVERLIKLNEFFYPKPKRRNFNCLYLGAENAVQPLKLKRRWKECKILIVDPIPEHYEKIKAQAFGKEDVHSMRSAIGTRVGMERLGVYDKKTASSFFPREKELFTLERNQAVYCLTLWGFMDRMKWSHLDLVLANCEGGELFLLDQLASSGQFVSAVCVAIHCGLHPIYRREEVEKRLEPLQEGWDIEIIKKGRRECVVLERREPC